MWHLAGHVWTHDVYMAPRGDSGWKGIKERRAVVAGCRRRALAVLPRWEVIHATAERSRRARSIRFRRSGECKASHRSLRRCTLSQKSALLPNTRPSMRAVSAVTARRLLHSSLTCLRGTPIAYARSPWVRPNGLRNSSTRISRILAGLRLVTSIAGFAFLDAGFLGHYTARHDDHDHDPPR